MADTAVAITAGAGTNIDTRTEATNSNHRQVIVIGDPSVNAGVAPVDVTNGLSVNVTNAALTVASHNVTNAGTFATQATLAAETTKNIGTVRMGDGTNTAAVKAASTAPAATDPAIVVAISPNTQNANGQAIMANSTPVAIASDQSTLPIGGNVAHDAVDSGNPVKQGFKATSSLSAQTPVSTTADRTDGFAGMDGVQITRPHCNLEDIVSGRVTDTAGTSTACIAASGASIKTYLTSVALTNSSATAVTVNVLDGASVKYTLSVPAGSGNNKEFTVPIPGTANTAWNFQSSAAATTITCSMIGFKSKV